MDTFLYHGDHKRDERGFVQGISGASEAIQQAMIRLSVPKGNFGLDKQLGSRLHTLGSALSKNQEELALEYAREAVLEVPDIRVISAKRVSGDAENLVLEFQLEYSGEEVPEKFQVMWEMNF